MDYENRNVQIGGSVAVDSISEIKDRDFPSVSDFQQQRQDVDLISPRHEFEEMIDKKQNIISDPKEFAAFIKQRKEEDRRKKQERKSLEVKKKKCQKKQAKQVFDLDQKEEPNNPLEESEKKRKRIEKSIESHVINYKLNNPTNREDSESTKLRVECRTKLFKYLLYGIQELKEMMDCEMLSDEEMKITKMSNKEPYCLAKAISVEIDETFLAIHNSGNRSFASKLFKNKWRILCANISEHGNLELRRKILTRQISANRLANMEEQDFYSPEVKKSLIEKQNVLLRQATKQKQTTISYDDADVNPQAVDSFILVKPKSQEVKKKAYEYLDSGSMMMISEFLKLEQLSKMRNLLQFDKWMNVQQRLIRHFDQTFITATD